MTVPCLQTVLPALHVCVCVCEDAVSADKRRKRTRGGQVPVWSVWWLLVCSEDAAGQRGESQVNYYPEREREGSDALHRLCGPRAWVSWQAASQAGDAAREAASRSNAAAENFFFEILKEQI